MRNQEGVEATRKHAHHLPEMLRPPRSPGRLPGGQASRASQRCLGAEPRRTAGSTAAGSVGVVIARLGVLGLLPRDRHDLFFVGELVMYLMLARSLICRLPFLGRGIHKGAP